MDTHTHIYSIENISICFSLRKTRTRGGARNLLQDFGRLLDCCHPESPGLHRSQLAHAKLLAVVRLHAVVEDATSPGDLLP